MNKKSVSLRVGVLVLTLLLLPCGTPLLADAAPAETSSKVGQVLSDTRLYFTAPLRWDSEDWSYFGATVAAVAAAHEFDAKVRDHFAAENVVLDGEDRHGSRDALPAAALVAGTWIYAALLQDSHGYAEGWSMLEAAGLSTVSSYALKAVTGRERPNETRHVDKWGQGGDSFPSLHTSAAFAIGTVLAESGSDRYRWIRRGLGYGIAASTAYRRLDGNNHWLSDTVAGAAIGIATANFVLGTQQHRRISGRLQIVPLDRGALLTYSVALE